MQNIPVEHINVMNLSSVAYDTLMDGIRQHFATRAGDDNTFMGVPMMTNAEGWLIISLDVPGSLSAQLLINLKTGYLSAIRNGENSWYYLKGEEPPEFFHAQVIKHLKSSSYLTLVNGGNWAEVAVGPLSLVDAYHTVLNFDNDLPINDPRVEVQRKALARLAVMFCEGSRLRTIRRLVSGQMDLGVNAVIDPYKKKKITSWSLISRFALHCRQRQLDNLPGYKADAMARLSGCQIFDMEHAIGDPDGELLLISVTFS